MTWHNQQLREQRDGPSSLDDHQRKIDWLRENCATGGMPERQRVMSTKNLNAYCRQVLPDDWYLQIDHSLVGDSGTVDIIAECGDRKLTVSAATCWEAYRAFMSNVELLRFGNADVKLEVR